MKTTKSTKKGRIQYIKDAINKNSDACLNSIFATYYTPMYKGDDYVVMGYTGVVGVNNQYADFSGSLIKDLKTGDKYGDLSKDARKSLLKLLEKRKKEIKIHLDFLKRAHELSIPLEIEALDKLTNPIGR